MTTKPTAPYKRPLIPTPPAADILAAIRRGQSYAELAAIHGVSASTLKRRVTDSGLVTRRHGRMPEPPRAGEDESWREEALCAQTDPEAWFPEKGASPSVAKRMCNGDGDELKPCPVKQECLAYALANDERFGVWGATTYAERKRLKRGQL